MAPARISDQNQNDAEFVFTLSDHEEELFPADDSDSELAPTRKANIGKKRKRDGEVDSGVEPAAELLGGGGEGPNKKVKKAATAAKAVVDGTVSSKEKSKKEKKQNKNKGKKGHIASADTVMAEDDAEEDDDDEDEAEVDQGEQDDALNPDFEFDAGEGGMLAGETIEDFDGWGVGGAGQDFHKTGGKEDKFTGVNGKGNKKGVDIDEIIARRLEMKKVKNNGSSNSQEQGLVDRHLEATSMKTRSLESEKAFEVGGYEDEDEDADGDDMVAEEALNFDDDELLATDGFGAGAASEEEDNDESDDDDQGSEAEDGLDDAPDSDDDANSVASPTAHPDDLVPTDDDDDDASDASLDNDPAEAAKRLAFFAPSSESMPSASDKQTKSSSTSSFQSFSLSRPLLRGIAALNFTKPTPIQARTIPIALLGKDVVGSAQTGSGKTAAFLLPILERLLYRPRKVPTTRVAILMPTRELAVQCFNVATQLAQFTDITFAQLVGGFSLREQEAVLKKRPDVVVCTPGRFIDHMRNSASFSVETLEILVLDEADRMLEDGFADELDEILKSIPRGRQTMLFSATMTESVDKLVRVGMDRPVRVSVDKKKETVGGLVQEFVRLRAGREDRRLASLLMLCTTVYTERVIIFFRQKKEAHRVRTIFGLFGIKAGELHGGMTQEQRITSVSAFRSGQITHLLATDLASRGLDIKNVATVVNYEAPQSHEIYLHRVGRTARAGKSGRACTIAAEPDRKVVKAAVKSGRAQGAKIVSRVMPAGEVDQMHEKIEGLQEEVDEILKEEKEERQLAQAETHLVKGENLIKHADEIQSRPKRTWFESEQDKRTAKKAGRAELNTDGKKPKTASNGDGSKRKLSGKDKKKLDDRRDRAEGKVWRKGKGSEAAAVAAAAAGKKARKSGGDKRKDSGGVGFNKRGGGQGGGGGDGAAKSRERGSSSGTGRRRGGGGGSGRGRGGRGGGGGGRGRGRGRGGQK